MKQFTITINDWCKSCGICAASCPAKALRHEPGDKPVFIRERCRGCQLCVLKCPDFAIKAEVIEP